MKAKEFAWKKFMRARIGHPKMENLWYSELRIQKYLTTNKFTPEEARTLLSFRTRLANFPKILELEVSTSYAHYAIFIMTVYGISMYNSECQC